MLIKGQNKNFANLDNVIAIYSNKVRDDKIEIICRADSLKLVVGTYSSEEKALKILDMITDAYAEGNELLSAAGKVFDMPADEEV